MSLISYSLSNVESTPSSASKKDRFIPSRAEVEDFAEGYKTSPKRRTVDSDDFGPDENRAYTKLITSNLNITKSLKKPARTMKELREDALVNPRAIELPTRARGRERKVPKAPFKVLDAPLLQDDFYFNVVDWSSADVLAVGLGEAVYTWNFQTNKVEKVVAFEKNCFVTGLCWDPRGDTLVLGTQNGRVELWDVAKGQKRSEIVAHNERVGAMSLFGDMLLTGSRDKAVILHDLRCQNPVQAFPGHKQEVCGLRWSPDGQYFASGGNDNKLFVFSPKMTIPIMKKNHKAAVKAIAWSERSRGLLATGAGTADRCIRIWNTNEKTLVDFKDTSSQICNIAFSKLEDEVITTHGFSLNEICVWRLKGLKKVAALTGHSSRVLYLAMDPRGEHIVTGAGDETLRFWNLGYPSRRSSVAASSFEALRAFR